jgi:hypothetical protein
LLRYSYRCQKYERHFGIHVNERYFCSMLTKFGISRPIFLKFDNVKLHENPSSRRPADMYGESDRRMYEQTDGRTGVCVEHVKSPKMLIYSIVFYVNISQTSHYRNVVGIEKDSKLITC